MFLAPQRFRIAGFAFLACDARSPIMRRTKYDTGCASNRLYRRAGPLLMNVIEKPLLQWSRRSPVGVFIQLVLVLLAAYLAAQAVANDDLMVLLLLGALPLALAVIIAVISDWRRGLYAFVFWILFEDIIRKYSGNNMAVFFAKDALVIILYLSFFRAREAKNLEKFRPPFRAALLLFFWLCLLQVFNPFSPSLFFGMLGIKMDFLYVPLLYVGYAFAKTEMNVQRLFSFLSVLILIVAGLGLAQSIIGPTFLNPSTLQDDLRALSTLYRYTSEGLMAYRPTSVFVSSGRFQNFLILSWSVSLGYAAYLVVRGVRKRTLAFATVAAVGAASVMSASRGVLMWNLGSTLVIVAGFLWGAPWRQRETMRVLGAIQRAAFLTGIAMILLMTIFPEALGTRLTIYSETLLPNSPTSELVRRTQTYPMQQVLLAFNHPHWVTGYGIGTSGLGLQYLRRFLNVMPLPIGVESGLGNIVVELGIFGLALWLVLGLAITISAWKVVKHLRGTPWFPLAFSIFLYAVLVFFPMTYVGMPYQDFLINAYLWLLIGIQCRLYYLKQSAKEPLAAGVRQGNEAIPLQPVVPVVPAPSSG